MVDSDGYYNTYLSTMTDGKVERKYLDSYQDEKLAIAYVDYMNKPRRSK